MAEDRPFKRHFSPFFSQNTPRRAPTRLTRTKYQATVDAVAHPGTEPGRDDEAAQSSTWRANCLACSRRDPTACHQREMGLSMIFVTHDIGAAIEVADRIAVMYAGRIVEEDPARTLLRAPRHPYTLALLKSRAHGALAKGSRLETIAGAPPDLSALPPGCAFAKDACRTARPEVVQLDAGHRARCLRTEATAAVAV